MYLIDIYFVILLHECLPRIAFSNLINCYHRGSSFPCEISIELEVISIFHHRKPRRGIELRIFRDSNLDGLNHSATDSFVSYVYLFFLVLFFFFSFSLIVRRTNSVSSSFVIAWTESLCDARSRTLHNPSKPY